MDNCNKVISAINGDKECFIQVVAEKKEFLYRTAFMYVKNEHDALEILDQTVYKAFLSIKKLKKPEYFDTWIIRILINCAIDMIRKNKKIISLNDDLENIKIDVYENHEEIIDLYDAIDSLDADLKAIIILKYFDGFTITEIGDIMGASESRVKNMLHKALVNLRIELKEGCANDWL